MAGHLRPNATLLGTIGQPNVHGRGLPSTATNITSSTLTVPTTTSRISRSRKRKLPLKQIKTEPVDLEIDESRNDTDDESQPPSKKIKEEKTAVLYEEIVLSDDASAEGQVATNENILDPIEGTNSENTDMAVALPDPEVDPCVRRHLLSLEPEPTPHLLALERDFLKALIQLEYTAKLLSTIQPPHGLLLETYMLSTFGRIKPMLTPRMPGTIVPKAPPLPTLTQLSLYPNRYYVDSNFRRLDGKPTAIKKATGTAISWAGMIVDVDPAIPWNEAVMIAYRNIMTTIEARANHSRERDWSNFVREDIVNWEPINKDCHGIITSLKNHRPKLSEELQHTKLSEYATAKGLALGVSEVRMRAEAYYSWQRLRGQIRAINAERNRPPRAFAINPLTKLKGKETFKVTNISTLRSNLLCFCGEFKSKRKQKSGLAHAIVRYSRRAKIDSELLCKLYFKEQRLNVLIDRTDNGFLVCVETNPGPTCNKCRQKGHLAKDCPNGKAVKTKGPRCFTCGSSAHMTKFCHKKHMANKQQRSQKRRNSSDSSGSEKEKEYKWKDAPKGTPPSSDTESHASWADQVSDAESRKSKTPKMRVVKGRGAKTKAVLANAYADMRAQTQALHDAKHEIRADAEGDSQSDCQECADRRDKFESDKIASTVNAMWHAERLKFDFLSPESDLSTLFLRVLSTAFALVLPLHAFFRVIFSARSFWAPIFWLNLCVFAFKFTQLMVPYVTGTKPSLTRFSIWSSLSSLFIFFVLSSMSALGRLDVGDLADIVTSIGWFWVVLLWTVVFSAFIFDIRYCLINKKQFFLAPRLRHVVQFDAWDDDAFHIGDNRWDTNRRNDDTHKNPLLARFKITTSFGWLDLIVAPPPTYITCSCELFAQVTAPRVMNMLTSEEFVKEKVTQLASTLESIRLNRYFAFTGQCIISDTSLLAMAFFRHFKERRDKLAFLM